MDGHFVCPLLGVNVMAKVTSEIRLTLEGDEESFVDVPASVVEETKAAMSAQAGVTQRWLKAQPSISATFGAPACYEAGNNARKLLSQFLTSVHPKYKELEAAKSRKEIARKAMDGEAENKAKLEYAFLIGSIDTDVSNAMRALRKYYTDKGDSTESRREGKTADDLFLDWAARAQKMADKEGTSSPDLTRLVFVSRVLKLLMTPDALNHVRTLTMALPIIPITDKAGPIPHPERKAGPVKKRRCQGEMSW